MLNIQENISLQKITSFGTGGVGRWYVEVTTIDEIREAVSWARAKQVSFFILGSGSNIIASDAGYDGLIIAVRTRGLDFVPTGDEVLLTAAAGEVWDEVVAGAVAQGAWGIENLSLIPGRAGAFVVQNVGAYGQEASQVVESVEAFDTERMEVVTLSAAECGFAYRQSIFNSSAKGRFIILSITLRLSQTPNPRIDYPDVIAYFAEQKIDSPTILQIRQAIITIRTNKFPDWQIVGTAGSFFKNLYLTPEQYNYLHARISEIFPERLEDLEAIAAKFPSTDGIKIPTAFLIDKVLNLKGTRIGGAVISEKQALAILNPEKKATSDEVMQLVTLVQDRVEDLTGIRLELEPECIGF